MFRLAFTSYVASAVCTAWDDDSLHLLQIASQKHAQNAAQSTFSPQDGVCSYWGDVHRISDFIPGTFWGDNQKVGLFNLANSKDGRFKTQAYQCPAWHHPGLGWINALAYDIDGTRIVILPPIYPITEENGPVYIRANGIEYTSAELPFTIPGTNIDIRAHKPPYGFHIVTDGLDAKVEMQTHPNQAVPFTEVTTGITLKPDNLPDLSENSFCTQGVWATPIIADGMENDWSSTLFTNADHDRICDYCEAYNNAGTQHWGKVAKCAKPPPGPPIPPAKEECEQNGCSWTHSQQLCSSLKSDDVLYNDCLFDFCLECEDSAAAHFVAEVEDQNPDPICVAGAPKCDPAAVCSDAVKMNTLTVAHNNLGGVGPDSGVEEIRYSNAAVMNGKAVDLVLTTDGAFKTHKADKNGNAGAFGALNVKCGTSVTINMKVVDSQTGSPVTIPKVALTWYDLDEGKKGKGRATVTTCGSTGAIYSDNTELTVNRQGACSTATSSVAGTGKDNPTSPHQLDSVQISRALTLPFEGVSEWSSTLSLAKGHGGRNFLFALEPSVACGLSGR